MVHSYPFAKSETTTCYILKYYINKDSIDRLGLHYRYAPI